MLFVFKNCDICPKTKVSHPPVAANLLIEDPIRYRSLYTFYINLLMVHSMIPIWDLPEKYLLGDCRKFSFEIFLNWWKSDEKSTLKHKN